MGYRLPSPLGFDLPEKYRSAQRRAPSTAAAPSARMGPLALPVELLAGGAAGVVLRAAAEVPSELISGD